MQPIAERRNLATVYISGPFSAPTIQGQVWNQREASAYATRLLEMGFAPLCPHTNVLEIGRLTYEEIMAVDFALLRQCDAIFLMPNWRESPGAVREEAHAQAHGVLVFEDLDELARTLARDRQSIERVA